MLFRMDTIDKIFKSSLLLNFLILWTVLLYPSGCELNTYCFDCVDKTDPFSCNVVRQCAPNQKCYSTSYFILNNPVQKWEFGCKDVSFCGLIIHDYNNITKRGRTFRRRLTSCNECCHGDYCNRVPCDEDSQKVMPKELVCHSCDGVQDPAMCNQTKRCAQGELCAVWTLANGLVSLGCKAKSVCDSEGNNLLFGKREEELDVLTDELDPEYYVYQDSAQRQKWLTSGERFGRVDWQQRSSVSSSSCRQCCLDPLCAASYCSKTNTLPPNAVTVTIPTTTLRPLLVKLVPVLVSTYEGDKAVFACAVDGMPPLTVEFSRSFDTNATTARIPSCDTNSSVSYVNQSCTFTHAQLSETGEISCTATDAQGQTITSDAKFIVEPYKKNLKAILSPTDKDLFPGTTTELECFITGTPPPSYFWLKNDSGSLIPIVNSLEFNISNSVDLSVLEVFPSVNSDLDGDYICRGNNVLEKLDLPFTLSLITKVMAVKTLSNSDVVESKQKVTFSCAFESYPPSTISWLFTTSSNQTLALNSSVSSTVQDRTTTSDVLVTFDFLQTNDVRYVKCTGNNSYFSNFSEASIKLLRPPRITTPSKTYQLSYGQPITLTCQADGIPDPHVSWSFVDVYDNPQILQGADLKDDGKILEVAHIRKDGKFTCYASNSVGSNSVSFPVELIKKNRYLQQ